MTVFEELRKEIKQRKSNLRENSYIDKSQREAKIEELDSLLTYIKSIETGDFGFVFDRTKDSEEARMQRHWWRAGYMRGAADAITLKERSKPSTMYEMSKLCTEILESGDYDRPVDREATSDAFLAGVKWQKNRGQTFESEVHEKFSGNPFSVSIFITDVKDYNPGDKLIIQIRKKDE